MCCIEIRRNCAGATGQPGRQLAPNSAAVTGWARVVADGGAARADDAIAADGGGVAAEGGGAGVHCTTATPAAVTAVSRVALRLLTVERHLVRVV